MKPGITEISYSKNKYILFTYRVSRGTLMFWTDLGVIISKGISILPEYKIHQIVRRDAKKKSGKFTSGHTINRLKERTDA